MKKTSILCLTLLSFLFAQSQIKYLKGTLESSQETPPTTSTGSGVVIVQYDMATKTIKLFGDYAGLTTPITGSHIHRIDPATTPPNPIVIDLVNTGGTTGTLSLTGTFTQAQEDSLLAGNMYANVHTSTNPGGELRAHLTVTSGQTTFVSGRFQGAQETPPNTSTASGSVYALVDAGTDSVFVTGNYTGLTTASTNAHVHSENPGTAGNVLFPIYHSSAPAGTVHAATLVSATAADSIATGHTYANVHSATYTNGEIRAQLINSTTVQYFAGELSGVNESTPNTSTARGTVIVSYNTETNILQLAGDYQNLSDTVTAANLYIGTDSIASLTTSGDSTGTISSVDTLTDAQEADLLAGNMYVNVLDSGYTGGEIRTQLVGTTSGQTQVFAVNLNTAEVVKPTISLSTAGGKALIIVDKSTGLTYVTGAFQGINSDVTGAHIHRGAVGDTSAVVLSLHVFQVGPAPHTGTFSGSGILTAPQVDSMISGLTYIDVHSVGRPYGAMRAQLGDLALPLKLTYFNGYKQRDQVELIWETSEELNVSHYEIEQLNITTNTWVTKGSVFSQGGNSAAKYSFTDVPNLYNNQYVIYRLKISDKDGKVTYSSMVKLNYEKLKAELFIQTNPVVNGELRYNITGLQSGKKAEVSIIDFNGRLLLRNTISTLTNNTLKIPHLSAGMYKVVVRIDDTMLQKSFIK